MVARATAFVDNGIYPLPSCRSSRARRATESVSSSGNFMGGAGSDSTGTRKGMVDRGSFMTITTSDLFWWRLIHPMPPAMATHSTRQVTPDGGLNTDHVRQSMATTALALLANGSADSSILGGQYLPWNRGSLCDAPRLSASGEHAVDKPASIIPHQPEIL